jgi:hypothetical protein
VCGDGGEPAGEHQAAGKGHPGQSAHPVQTRVPSASFVDDHVHSSRRSFQNGVVATVEPAEKTRISEALLFGTTLDVSWSSLCAPWVSNPEPAD